MKHSLVRRALGTVAVAVSLSLPAAQAAVILDPAAVPARTQMTIRYSDGVVASTPNSRESRPALSLVKLYLGYWVLRSGAPEDAARVENMIRFSEDATATYLDRRYPQAIPEVIARFGLQDTRYPGYWGNSTTSTEDLTRFLSAIVADPVAAPIVEGMRTAAPVAADGYRQDYGTARIPGVIGTKFGWSDFGDVNATASFGPGYTVAASTYGNAAQLTVDVLGALRIVADAPLPPDVQVLAPFLQWLLTVLPPALHEQARNTVSNVEESIRPFLPSGRL